MPDKPPLILKRYGSTPYGTFGELNIRGKVFYTVERQWLDNVRSISCVPILPEQIMRHGIYNLYGREMRLG